ncbi:hypothetical protein M3P21_21120 [Ruegeria sp. 2012CJ41-6]|uniref:Uncharacterized protein n=1 Tax=Ruegeria spongiae TaxID=2942209 RepID=A0ABT0Q824_9RHOB|nr:hypothetical protein [Ruegeria spongiae]MCL6286021.1 hypothetical protein [Ruegeria spongiae]
MKWFDPYEALARMRAEGDAGEPEISTRVENPNPNTAQTFRDNQDRPAETPHGNSVGGRHRTWTGKVVSLEAWRQLTEWEKHGPNGRVWDGSTQQWRTPDEQ